MNCKYCVLVPDTDITSVFQAAHPDSTQGLKRPHPEVRVATLTCELQKGYIPYLCSQLYYQECSTSIITASQCDGSNTYCAVRSNAWRGNVGDNFYFLSMGCKGMLYIEMLIRDALAGNHPSKTVIGNTGNNF